MPTKYLLMLAYYFPPMGGAGVQRALKFVKFLPDFGWLPVILTTDQRYATLLDPTLETEIPPIVKIYRTTALIMSARLPWRLRSFISRWLLVVDEQLGWFPFAVSKGHQLIEKYKPDVIFSTSAPYTDHLIALHLTKKWQIPWIADFRDPWIGNFNLRFPTKLHAAFTSGLERKIMMKADLVTVVNDAMKKDLIRRYPLLDQNKFVTIPNGYDHQDFERDTSIEISRDKFIITYTGSFYADTLRPDNFLLSLRNLIDRKVISQDKLMVLFVGNIDKRVQRMITSSGLDHVARIVGYLDHRSSIGYLLSSNLLLLIIGTHPGSEMVMTGKIYEYLAARKPILALSPPGVASELIKEAQAGVIVEPDDLTGISAQIDHYYRCWEKGIDNHNPKLEVIKQYDRRRLTAKLANLLDNFHPNYL